VKIITGYSPIAIHFGEMESRLLQLAGGPGGWKVHLSAAAHAEGGLRQPKAIESFAEALKGKKIKGKDAVLATSGHGSAVNLVPLDPHHRSRLQQTLQETALRSIDDTEGVAYRYLPLASGSGEQSQREEFLLLSLGQTEIRRCTEASDLLGLRPVGLENSAFPIARALSASHGESEDPWGFLHIGFASSLFGIVHQGEIRFLKPMQSNGETWLNTIAACINEEEDQSQVGSQAVLTMQRQAVGHAVQIMHALRLEAEALAQEIRACLRHFSARHKGARLESVFLTGFGAALPEVETAIGNALAIPTAVAKPFSALGMDTPPEILAEEHLWCAPLGLALRGAA
jgi:Tfp pilus assembly PilM family ATPase